MAGLVELLTSLSAGKFVLILVATLVLMGEILVALYLLFRPVTQRARQARRIKIGKDGLAIEVDGKSKAAGRRGRKPGSGRSGDPLLPLPLDPRTNKKSR